MKKILLAAGTGIAVTIIDECPNSEPTIYRFRWILGRNR